jgi:small conductance mechanosensitive channel
MSQIIQTVFNSVQDLVGTSVQVIPAILVGLIIILLTRYAAQFMQNLGNQIGKRTLRSQSLQLLLSKTAYVLAWVIGITLACVIAFPGLRLGDIIATLGLGSVAIGFAFQDIFKNFLAGVLILLQEPFRIGDQIIIEGYEGTVEQIDIRTTKIKTYKGEKVILPNATLFTNAVQVRTAYGIRRTDLAVGVDYKTPLSEAAEILEKIIARVEGVVREPAPEIDLVNFNDSSIDFQVRYWTSAEQKNVRRTQTKAILAIKKAFDDADINIPYPIRTLYFYDQEKYNDYLPENAKDASSGNG